MGVKIIADRVLNCPKKTKAVAINFVFSKDETQEKLILKKINVSQKAKVQELVQKINHIIDYFFRETNEIYLFSHK